MKNNFNLLASNNKRSIKNILTIGLFAVVMISSLFSNGLIISQAMASGNTTSVANNTSTTSIDNTSLTVVANPNIVQAGGQVTLTATIIDSSSSPTSPTGSVSWGDQNAGGSFSPSTCTLSTGTCTTLYTPSANSPSNVIIIASYGGDTTHNTSSSTLSLVVAVVHTTSVIVTPNSGPFVSGTAVAFSVTVTDTSNSPTSPTGIVSWSDGNAGGSFSSTACTLSANTCTTSYTPSSSSPNSITITATYGGDTTHQTNSGTSILTINSLSPVSITVSPNPSSYVTGTTLTFTAIVTDTSSSPTTPTGTITWGDGNLGGIFSSSSCTLSANACTTSYTPSSSSPNSITITASYGGDTTHNTSSGTSSLTVSTIHATAVSVTSNPATVPLSGSMNVTVTVTDSSSSPITPTSLCIME